MAVAAAGIAALADAAPTGVESVDTVERAAFAVALVLAGSRARRWSLVSAAVLVAVVGEGWFALVGFAGVGMGWVLVSQDRRSRVIGAAVGALVAVGLQHAGGHQARWGTLAVAAAAVPILVSGYRNAPRLHRRRIRTGVLVVVALTSIVLVAALSAGLTARRSLQEAVSQTAAGVGAVEQGDREPARARFVAAGEAFEEAGAQLDSVWAPIAEALPVVSQNLRAVRSASEQGAAISAIAAETSGQVDYERLSLDDGGVDLSVLESFRRPVGRAHRALTEASASLAEARSPWLTSPISDRLDEFAVRVGRYRTEVALARHAIDEAPPILGGGGTRRYLVLLGNPAEARDLGGHIGNWAELTLDGGRIDLVEVGGPNDLVLPRSERSGPYPASLLDLQPRRFPQNWGADPDLPTVARLSAELFEEATGRAIDGVLYADPRAFAAFVALTGPKEVERLEPAFSVTSANAEKFLVSDQYELFRSEAVGDRSVSNLVRAVFDDLTGTKLPKPQRLAKMFSPLVHEGRFAFESLHPGDRKLLDRLAIRDEVPDAGDGDLLGVVTRNANPSKIDAYLRRDTSADIRWDPETGVVSTTVTVQLANFAPSGGLTRTVSGNALGRPPGTNVTDLAVLTPLELRSVSIDGERSPARPVFDGRYWRHTVRVELAPGARRTVRFRLEGSVAPGPEHHLEVLGQPLVNESTVRIRVRAAGGRIRADGRARASGDGVRVEVPGDQDVLVPLVLSAN
jgi:hypothetical protein